MLSSAEYQGKAVLHSIHHNVNNKAGKRSVMFRNLSEYIFIECEMKPDVNANMSHSRIRVIHIR